MLTANQVVLLEIEKPAAGGRMIARADGQIVLVAGAIPGERASVRIERVGKDVAYGDAVSIDRPSPDRREPAGDPSCGGCLYAHIAYPRQLQIKSAVIADALGRIGRIVWPSPVAVRPSLEEGYRMRARLHLRGRRLGFFREGSHDLCDARASRQLLPASSDALEGIAASLGALGLPLDAEVDLSENIEASERAVHLECRLPVDPHALPALAASPGLTGITLGHSGGGPRAAVLSGDPYVTDRLSIEGRAFVIRRHVLSFFQGNRFLLRDLIAHVVEHVSAEADVVDLYAGVGLFSVAAAAVRGARVAAVEGDRVAADDLAANAAALAGAVTAHHESVEAYTARRRLAPDTLIVDPPRTGMSKASVQGAIGLGAGRVIYVSCDPPTLARDARRFIDAGYELRAVDAFDLFPNTPHVETVVRFDRR